MHKCPFHDDSTAVEQDGEISAIHCPCCGDYRISNVALQQIAKFSEPPRDWEMVVAKRQLISTRDTRELVAV